MGSRIRTQAPPFVAVLYKAAAEAAGAERERLLLWMDFVETALRACVVILDSDRAALGLNEPSQLGPLLDKLAKPSMGHWLHAAVALADLLEEADSCVPELSAALRDRSFRRVLNTVVEQRNRWAHPSEPPTNPIARDRLAQIDFDVLETGFSALAIPLFVTEGSRRKSSSDVSLVRRFAGLDSTVVEMPPDALPRHDRPFLLSSAGDVLVLEPGIVCDRRSNRAQLLLLHSFGGAPQYRDDRGEQRAWSEFEPVPVEPPRDFFRRYRAARVRGGTTMLQHLPPEYIPQIEGYRLTRQLGAGARGEVWLAQGADGRKYAVRILHPSCAQDRVLFERFRTELQVLRTTRNPSIVRVVGDGEVDGRPYLVMDYVNGTSLQKTGRLSSEAAMVLIRGLLGALKEMHGRGVVHRDLRPSGVLLTSVGHPVLVDFAIVQAPDTLKLTHAGLGDYRFAAPEQLMAGSDATAGSDLFAAARVLGFAMTGSDDPRVHEAQLSPELLRVYRKATASQPGDRYRSAADMLLALPQARPPEPSGLGPGSLVAGRFEVLEELSDEGGMARVFRVRNTQVGRILVLKVLNPELCRKPPVVERFLAEGRIQGQVVHRNIAQVVDHVDADGLIGLLMEYVEGASLAKRLEHGPVAPDEATAILLPVLDAMATVHARGIVHRDLKPANIVLADGPEGLRPVVIDFGVAKLLAESDLQMVNKTRAGTGVGTAAYMSPEQVRGQAELDHRSDIWSLGIVLYEMLTGRQAFPGGSDFEAKMAVVQRRLEPLPSSLPGELREAVERATALDPGQRFQSCQDFAAALESRSSPRAAPTRVIDPRPPPPSPPVAQGRSHRRLGLGLVAAALGLGLIAACATGASLLAALRKTPAPVAVEATATQVPMPAMVAVEAGTFWMGSPGRGEPDRDHDEVRHEVTLTRDFLLSETEVTQEQFEAVMGFNPSARVGPKLPVTDVTWFDAVRYCNKLSESAGLRTSYDLMGKVPTWPRHDGYRLPTEAEWEFAARAGESFRYAGSDQPGLVAWTKETTDGAQPVGRLAPNALGLYDMSGNVYEWVWDWHPCDDAHGARDCEKTSGYDGAGTTDPVGVATGTERVFRGGSWQQAAKSARVANRGYFYPNKGRSEVGFRVARTAP